MKSEAKYMTEHGLESRAWCAAPEEGAEAASEGIGEGVAGLVHATPSPRDVAEPAYR